jgi:hypothetical protein
MRWHVHGTDALTGQDVELAINDPQAEQAVKAAIDRRIVVSHVTADAAHTWRWMLRPAALLCLVSLAGISAGLLAHNITLRKTLDKTILDQSRLGKSIAEAERAVAEIRSNPDRTEDTSEQMKKLADDLAAARSRMSLTEQQLSATHQHLNNLEAAAMNLSHAEAEVATLTQQLAAARAQIKEHERVTTQLWTDLAHQARRVQQLERLPAEADVAATARIASLEAANHELTGELENLKEQLLIAVAKAHVAATAPAEAVPASPPPPALWSLRISYDDAQKFLALNTDPETVTTRTNGAVNDPEADAQTLFTSSGALAENALRIRFVHDRDKEQVFSAALVVPPAADAPKEKAEENAGLIADFLRLFVPGVEEPESIVAYAMKQAASLNEDRRALFLAQDCKITAWTTKAGLVTIQVDANRDPQDP